MEARTILAAREQRIPCLTNVDYWQAYAARLTYPTDAGLEADPDKLAVLDEGMRDAFVELGVPAARVVITGSPTLERAASGRVSRRASRKVLFLSQPFDAVHGIATLREQPFLYSESSVLKPVLDAAAALGLTVSVRPHPREGRAVLQEILRSHTAFAVFDESRDLAAAMADVLVVIGMTTMGLVEAALAGVPTLSIQPVGPPVMLPTIRSGLTTLVTETGKVPEVLARVLTADDADASSRDAGTRPHRGAAVRLADEIRRMLRP
jgi:hypothetical protein